ncbi:MAG: ABC transporter permease [Flavobacteriaceae bacterium]|jgi:putative ABC transport system permease protein|nr:ABC transporter permease [Flavobacteriaceae bacterium]
MTIFNRETWDEVYHTLSKNKLRTALTMIGVAWGMFLYVFLLGAAKGAENGFNKIFDGFATNSIFLWGSNTSENYKGFSRGRKLDLHMDDIEYLKKLIPEIDFIVPRSSSGAEQGNVTRNNVTKYFSIFGDYPVLTQLEKKEVIKGRLLNENDISENKKVVVIGKEVAEQLFKEGENPIGEYIKINGIYFQVVGVCRNPTSSGIIKEDVIYTPFNTYQTLYNRGNRIGWMVISIKPQYNVREIEKKVKIALKRRYDVSPTDERAFGAWNFAEDYKKIINFLKGLQILTWIVGGLTILAGVIAISNILLITVKERTLEIGIRRALGAKPSEIRAQVLTESAFLTIFSGMLGFIGGILMLIFVSSVAYERPEIPFYNPTVSPWNILMALCLMISLGLSIGLIPAQRAVQIKPIDALRPE